MGDIIGFPLSTNLNPEHALKAAMTEVQLNGVSKLIVLGEFETGELLVVPSKLNIAEADALCKRLQNYISRLLGEEC